MGRKYSKLGKFGQIKHPHIRGGLSPNHHNAESGRVVELDEWIHPETDENYFVPSFSVRRHLHRDAEDVWIDHQKEVKKRIGSSYKVIEPEEVAIKMFEQRALIRGMKIANIHPEVEDIDRLARGLADQLTKMLAHASSPLAVPLGRFAMFGPQDRPSSLAYEIAGWRGDRPKYGGRALGSVARAMNECVGYDTDPVGMSPLAVLQAERELIVNAATEGYGDQGLRAENLVVTPHVSFARPRKFTHEARRHDLYASLSDIALDGTLFADPIIEVSLERGLPPEQVHVAHSYSGLGDREYAA